MCGLTLSLVIRLTVMPVFLHCLSRTFTAGVAEINLLFICFIFFNAHNKSNIVWRVQKTTSKNNQVWNSVQFVKAQQPADSNTAILVLEVNIKDGCRQLNKMITQKYFGNILMICCEDVSVSHLGHTEYGHKKQFPESVL